jgi:hypothetical protein
MKRDYRATRDTLIMIDSTGGSRTVQPGKRVRLDPAADTTTALIDGGWVVPVKVTTGDIREYAARLLESHGWTPDVTPIGRTPYNVYRALEKAALELDVPAMRMDAQRELRCELGITSLFEDPARPTTAEGWITALRAGS